MGVSPSSLELARPWGCGFGLLGGGLRRAAFGLVRGPGGVLSAGWVA